MNIKTKTYSLVLVLLLLCMSLFSQEINTKITVVSPYEPSISDAQKINTMPVFSDTSKLHPSFNYAIQSNKLAFDYTPRFINPAKMVADPQPVLYKSYVKMGLGNKVTPFAEVNVASLRSKNTTVGFYGMHQSSHSNLKIDNGQKMWAGYNDNIAKVYGKRIWENFTVNADAGVKHNTVYFYGFNADTNLIPYGKKDLRQDYLNMDANTSIESNHPYDSSKLYYKVNLNYNYITDHFLNNAFFKNFEHGTHLNALLKKNVNGFYASVYGSVDNYNRSSSLDSLTNTIVTLNPSIMKSSTDWKFKIGLKAIINHFGPVNPPMSVYPDINFDFNAIQDVVRVYMGMDGGLKANSYSEIVKENPFIVPNLLVRDRNPKAEQGGLTYQKINVFGGLKGSLSRAFEFNLAVSYSKIANQYFFINDTINRFFFQGDNKYIAGNQFIAVYDDIELIRYLAECNIRFSSSFNIFGRLDINNYKTFKQAKAWNMPTVKASLSPQYNLRNKILVNVDVNYFGKRYALAPKTKEIITMKDIIDLNLGMEYRYTKLISLFVRFNNLAAYKYYYWNQFPMQRFFVMAGFTYSL
jgi:hypothetical protein